MSYYALVDCYTGDTINSKRTYEDALEMLSVAIYFDYPGFDLAVIEYDDEGNIVRTFGDEEIS